MQLKAAGKPIGPGAEILIKGLRGTYKIQSVTWTSSDEPGRPILNCLGGRRGHYLFRAFYLDQVRRVLPCVYETSETLDKSTKVK